jgi:hypothetical protein
MWLASGPNKDRSVAVNAGVIEAEAGRYHGVEPEMIDWTPVERPI